ncbi:MAG: nickel-responsive transcriptional regulator NikR [Betaproteobacteria bacterium]|nr:nickel-responsive transcriptional regulator NikR [Betaproteobacteria bacterium]
MKRLTISVNDDLADQFEAWMAEAGYDNRSEAFRDLLRHRLGEEHLSDGTAENCVATVSYVYNHHERQLATRMMDLQHSHHDLTLSTMHAHLDHDNCVETVILRGATAAVMQFAKEIVAERGVRHGQINLIPVEVAPDDGHHHHHEHLHPLT